ncbi:MAG: cytochrome c4 [Betaproteobacteria bacterium]|nr:cytochrome c4 [Betaproteobacteria bacterium]
MLWCLVLCGAHGALWADAEAGKKLAEQTCAACHGADGNSKVPTFPILAGQTMRYLYLQLKDFKEGARTDPAMSPYAATLSRQDMLDVAEYFSKQVPRALDFTPDPAKAELGRKKADEVLCTMCHLGGFKGQNEIPRVAGQYPDYIVKQLRAFKARTRTNDAGNMTSVAQTITNDDIDALAQYIAGLQ